MPATAEALHVEATPHEIARRSCPVCERPTGAVFLSAAEIAAELDARDRFFAHRLSRRFSRQQLRDLTNVVLGTPSAILRCMRCGLLIRDAVPGEEVFRDDRYGDDVLEGLHDAHALAFREKEIDYRSLLPPRARVVEVGSYVGGFLSVAAEWGWSAIGTDIGHDAVRFCRGLGLDARCLQLHECELEDESFDAVFVWNCFEQIADARILLAETHRLLRAGGLLAIRIPDAGFYMQHRQDGSALAVLAYNSLLGWPHRFGYDCLTLRRLVERHGFAFLCVLRRAAMRPLRDALRGWARQEEAAMIGGVNHGWIELTFRKAVRICN